MNRKFRKLVEDPVAYALDSKVGFLKALGERAFRKQTERYEALGKANNHRLITVIMTAYNTGGLIEKAVRSVLAQSHENLELFVIDDASTDDTQDVLEKLAKEDARIRLFHSPTNHGTYWSKNWCLKEAKGEFVTFHDSDDVSDPKRLQMQLGAMLDGKGAVAATCRWKRVDTDGNEYVIDGQRTRTATITLMIRREEVLKKAGFFDTVRIAADSEYTARIRHIFGGKQLRNMRHQLYTGLLRDGSLTRGEKSGFEWVTEGFEIKRQVLGDRANYQATYKEWHAGAPKVYVPFPLDERPFHALAGICGGCDDKDMTQVVELSAAEDAKQ